MSNRNNILIVAGEISGDLQASLLVREFRKLAPGVHFWGFGGEKMRSEGVETIVDVSELAVMGLFDVVKHIPRLRALRENLICHVKERRPSGVILVDYPGFNLSLAERLRNFRTPVGYYISPQIWAWGEKRIEKVRKYIDKMVCILPFEKEFYFKRGIDVEYVGHPFVDIVKPEMSETVFFAHTGVDKDFLLLLPGSRRKEISRLLPKMLQAYSMLKNKYPQQQAMIASAQGMDEYIHGFYPEKYGVPIVCDATYSAMAYAKCAIVASGSATLECLVSNLPSAVIYRVDPLSWAIGKWLIKTPHIALANLVAEERVFPELIQSVNARVLSRLAEKLLFEKQLRNEMIQKMRLAVANLGAGGAAQKAAIIFSKLFLK